MSASNRSRKSRRRFNYGCFEPRRMLAGDVTVFEWDGNLFIRGDAEANQIQLIANEDAQLKVVGVSGTTINHGSEFVVSGSSGLIDSSSATTQFAGGLRLNLGFGNDSLEVTGAQFKDRSVIFGGPGHDTIELSSSSFHEHLTIQTFDGDDNIAVSQSEFLDDLYVFSLDGADSVELKENLTLGHAIVVTGNHSDHVKVDGNDLMGDIQLVLTGDGDDDIELINPNVGNNGFGVYGGHGSDRVIAEMTEGGEMLGLMGIHGQGGIDALFIEGVDTGSEMLRSDGFENNGGEIVFAHAGQIDAGIEVFDLGERSKQFGAERVQFDEATMISSVQWQGTYDSNSVATQDIFVIEIYEDVFLETQWQGDYNAPSGDPLAKFTVGDGIGESVVRTDTGEVLGDGLGRIQKTIFSYEANIVFEMQADKAYWVSIHSIKSDQIADDAKSFELGLFPYNAAIVNQSAYFTGGFNNRGEFVSFWLPSSRWAIALRS